MGEGKAMKRWLEFFKSLFDAHIHLIAHPPLLLRSHVPSHASREIILISGSLTSCDPGNIFDSIDACKLARIRVSIVGLAAEVGILKTIAKETGGKVMMERGWW